MNIKNINKFELQYFQVTEIWKRFCELHNELLDITFDEYSMLLESNIESLTEKVKLKEIKIQEIASVEKLRAQLIIEISDNIEVENGVNSVSDLLRIMCQTKHEEESHYLTRFNNLLIDIIEKIQEQNKRNQMFINKALISLKDIRLEAMGNKSYQTYNSTGSSQQVSSLPE